MTERGAKPGPHATAAPLWPPILVRHDFVGAVAQVHGTLLPYVFAHPGSIFELLPTRHKVAIDLDNQTTGHPSHEFSLVKLTKTWTLDAWLKHFDRAAVSRIRGIEDPKNSTQVRALGQCSHVESMDVATCEDIPFLVRRVVREELVRLQAGGVHHQCSFAACPEPPPYWMRERHVENRPRTETADFTPRIPFFPTGRGHHQMSSSRRAAPDLRPSSTRPLPEDYYPSSQNVPAERDPSPRTSATSALANTAASTAKFFDVSGSYVRNACPATFFDAPSLYARNLDLSPGRPPSPTTMT
ncbi:hypothetical protein HPB51_027664 [Rhipicephalus microplus]|uniref:Uncharacterized protein n=1 Tax=Rhipicephalus microplus TaxID=6941 RepID=A0A9J6CZL9_RHIMP|nr:hypothetical protein HPB51_027664 [Rhipicephalus microplus]